ncbi:MAG: Mth938-like domain-containing protein [Phenylobacterium sp.]
MSRSAPQVDAFGGGGFRLSGEWRPGSVLILDDTARDWGVLSSAGLSAANLSAVLSAGPGVCELLVLGMGVRNGLPPREVREAFLRGGIGLEFLDTPAAARLYNLLTAEGRRVAAALIAI